jgi:hypothetical protein
MRTDWLPRRREEQLAMAEKWIIELPKANGAWTVTPAEVSELADHVEDVQNALRRRLQNPGPVETARVRTAFAAMVRFMRNIRARRLFSPPMEDGDFVRLGLRLPDTVRTQHTAVNEEVDFVLEIRGTKQVHVRFWVMGQSNTAKPAGYDGAVIVWGMPDAPPDNADELPHHTMASRTPHTLKFDETDRGKTVYIALQWQNERGITGAWSDIKSTVIP